MEVHPKNTLHILRLIGLKKAPSKSTIQRARMKIGIINMLTNLNDTIIDKFKKKTWSAHAGRGSRDFVHIGSSI